MELRQLEYFAAVARHRHFTRAAEAIYVTQSAISQQIGRLERELGVALLRRTSRGVELTPAGEDLLRRAEAILASVAEARATMDAHAGVARGVVRVAVTAGEALRVAASLAAFHEAHPGVQVALRVEPAGDVVRSVRAGAADVGVAALAEGEPAAGVEAVALEPERLVLAGPPGFAAPGASVDGLRGEPLVLGERGSALREVVMAACAARGFSPVPRFEVGDPATVRTLVHAGLGLSVVPAWWLDHPGAAVETAELDDRSLVLAASVLTPSGGASPVGALLAEALVLSGDKLTSFRRP